MTTLELWPANLSLQWRLVTDAVMGGVSRGTISREIVDGREAIRMRGEVSTENNGGFLQITLDLAPEVGFVRCSQLYGI